MKNSYLDHTDIQTINNTLLMDYTSSALSFVDDPKSLHPTIYKILENTYFQEEESGMDKKDFINKWSRGLKNIINLNPSLAKILEKTAEDKSKICLINEQRLFENNTFIKGVCYFNLDIYIAVNRPVNEVLTTFMHELTHKLIQMIYDNDMLPYKNGENFAEMDLVIHTELKLELIMKLFLSSKDKIYPKSWLESIIDKYSQEDVTSEILPHFIEHITKSLLNNEVEKGVSFKFATIMWNYFHAQLKLELSSQELPTLSYYSDVLINEHEELINDAVKISTCQEPQHSWFDTDAGKLAFKSLSISKQKEYLNQLFTLPDENLIEILQEYLIPLYQSNSDQSNYILISKLNKLKDKIINPIIINTPLNQLFEVFDESEHSDIEKWLKKMTISELYQIIENQTPEFLKFCGKKINNDIINSLTNIENPQLNHLLIIKTYEKELIQYCSSESTKNKITSLVDKYNQESILENHSAHQFYLSFEGCEHLHVLGDSNILNNDEV